MSRVWQGGGLERNCSGLPFLDMPPILISNSFPFSLVRRPIRVEPRSAADLVSAMRQRPWVSAWGHENTLTAASAIARADLRPAAPRPALSLNPDLLPCLQGQCFDEIWLLSPDYAAGFRPQIGEELPAGAILSWQVLFIGFLPSNP
jgi:hypothetical protein